MSTYYTGSETWDPGSISDNAAESEEVTATGAVRGDWAEATFSLDLEDMQLTADVTADNVVTCVLTNTTSGSLNLSEGTLRVKVTSRTGQHQD